MLLSPAPIPAPQHAYLRLWWPTAQTQALGRSLSAVEEASRGERQEQEQQHLQQLRALRAEHAIALQQVQQQQQQQQQLEQAHRLRHDQLHTPAARRSSASAGENDGTGTTVAGIGLLGGAEDGLLSDLHRQWGQQQQQLDGRTPQRDTEVASLLSQL